MAGPQPRTYTVGPGTRSTSSGTPRLSGAQGIAIVAASIGIVVLLGVLIAKTGGGRMMRALADDLPLAAISGVRRSGDPRGVDRLRSSCRARRSPCRTCETSFNPQLGFTLLLPIFAAVVLGGIGSVYGALVGGLALGLVMELSTWPELGGGVNPTYKPVVVFATLIVVLLGGPQGLFGKALVVLSTIASFGFWSFVGIVAGIYTLFALGIQVQFGFAGLLRSHSWASRVHDGDPRRKEA